MKILLILLAVVFILIESVLCMPSIGYCVLSSDTGTDEPKCSDDVGSTSVMTAHIKTDKGSLHLAYKNGDNIMGLEKLSALRMLMARQANPLLAYIIPTADAHNSEYIAETDARREWITGFTGSAGTALVTADQALLWTDGRYYTQFDQEVDTTLWTLMKQSLSDTPTLESWLTSNLPYGSHVGIDATTMSRKQYTPLKTKLELYNLVLTPSPSNLVDQVRLELNEPAPTRPNNPLIVHPSNYTGKTAGTKIAELRSQMLSKNVTALVLTALDDIAYTLNVRGSDIPYNPVFFSYLLIPLEGECVLFWGDDGVLSAEMTQFLHEEGVQITGRPYHTVYHYLEEYSNNISSSNGDEQLKFIWMSHDGSEAIHRAAEGNNTIANNVKILSEVSPVAIMKVVKNEVELEGMRRCHVRDGTALIRFWRWLHEQIEHGAVITEIEAANKLEQFRSEEADYVGASFSTISAAGENGAVIHYKPSPVGEQRVIKANDIYLLDSGAQYRDGTTDVTRTRHMNQAPTQHQRNTFTRVLKGQINMGSAVFPSGVTGNTLDTLARKYLWDVGLDYGHGTGHGVGSYLNVHEGPGLISYRVAADDPGMKQHMIYSNEPGYYEVNQYGIRHEDLVEVKQVTPESDHPKAQSLMGEFSGITALGFHTITLVPHQREFIDVTLLTNDEIDYIDKYHARVYNTISPILKERGLTKDDDWLYRETRPLLTHQVASGRGGGPSSSSLILHALTAAIMFIYNR